MNAANTVLSLTLLRPSTVFRPRQLPVAGKILLNTDTMMESSNAVRQIPRPVALRELIKAGSDHVADVVMLEELLRQTRIAEKFVDAYVLLRDLSDEWDRFAALYPEAASDGWLGLLVNRARVLRTEIDSIAYASSD